MSPDPPAPWSAPFVVEVAKIAAVRHQDWDLYPAVGPTARMSSGAPLVVLVHGGPLPPDIPHRPREWPVYQGYGSLLAASGATAAVIDHPFHSRADFDTPYGRIRDTVELARQTAGVEPDRVVLWHFSGSAPMAAPWLAEPPPWLRCVAFTYPILDDRPGVALPVGFRPIDTLTSRSAKRLPRLVLTRVGAEAPATAAGVDRFISAARAIDAELHVIDVPHGVHGYDFDEPTPESQQAVLVTTGHVLAAVGLEILTGRGR